MDGLAKREETPLEMTEHFLERDDFQYYRHVQYGKRQRKLEPASTLPSSNPRPILVSSSCKSSLIKFDNLELLNRKTDKVYK